MGKKKKGRKKTGSGLLKLDAADLVKRGEEQLRIGNYREAIKVFKLARKKQPADSRSANLLIRSYALRENQLRQKGLVREAESLHAHSLKLLPDMAQLSAETLVLSLQFSDAKNALSLYNRFLAHHKPAPEVERIIAGTLLAEEDWSQAQGLPDKAPLKAELPLLREARQLMDAGRWEDALGRLHPVARKSPLSAVKLLCRAMVCFYNHDDTGMRRALAMIPDASGLTSLVAALKTAPENLAPLWRGRLITEADISAFQVVLKSNDLSETARAIEGLAGAINPQNPQPAMEQLLCLLWPLVVRGVLPTDDIEILIRLLGLPPHRGEALSTRFYYLESEDPLGDTIDYLNHLAQEFPDPEERAIAASMVISTTVDRIFSHRRQPIEDDWLEEADYGVLGITSPESLEALFEMALKALEYDPLNPQVLALLEKMPRRSRKTKQLAEKGLLRVKDHLPEDPRPCLALAKLYAEKNAFRKVEGALKEARRRAPHDERVKEFHALALVRSIDINLKRKKDHLVETDLQRAEKISTRRTRPLVIARRVLFDTEYGGQRTLFNDGGPSDNPKRYRAVIDRHINPLSVAERLEVLGTLSIDILRRPQVWSESRRRCLHIVANTNTTARTLKSLPSRNFRNLLLLDKDRLPGESERRAWLDFFLMRRKGILDTLSHEDLLPLLDAMLEVGYSSHCLEQIQRRIKTTPEPYRALLGFYRIVIGCITQQDRPDGDVFQILIDRVAPEDLEMFRTASARLAKFAWGPLKAALELFDFELLDGMNAPPFPPPIFPGGWIDDEDEEEEDDDNPFDDMFFIIDMIEDLIEATDLRGASKTRLKQQRSRLMSEPDAKKQFKKIANSISPEMAADLSPEARYIIFG